MCTLVGVGRVSGRRRRASAATSNPLYRAPSTGSCANGPLGRAFDPGRADYNQGFNQHMAKHSPSLPSPPQGTPPPASYEEALAELEGLVGAMERGEMPLDRLLESYRRGAELLGFCRGRLEAVEAQVKILDDGQLKPWVSGTA